MSLSRLTLVPLALAASPALAHPGHGHGDGHSSLLHYLSSPEHLWPAAAVLLLAAVIGGAWLWRRSRRRKDPRS
ncbi:hypothetical protein [Thioalkalivibrio sp. AKL17]|uniref:hypothetical protein n=1 Tax=Thioalkalivibrio sp. AKL17 TaxID=1158160 RepID=UPI00037648A2|nr:hypothetical protein [Thioalkalivibrio sp. AKL17]